MRVQVYFHGRVQGVGFRATARSIAAAYPITGWVRNEPDMSVLLQAQGDPAEIDAFLDELARVMSRNIRATARTTIADRPGESAFIIDR